MTKLIKSVISIAMAFVLIFSVGCKKEEGDKNVPTIVPRPPVEKVLSLKKTSLDMTVGNIIPLEIDVYDRESSNPVEWSSQDETIAKIEQIENGEVFTLVNVVAVREGTTNIVVTQGELMATCEITTSFKNKVAETVVSVDDEFNIQSNNGFKLSPRIKFDGNFYDDGEFTYSVADTTNFSIEDGVLTGLTNGASTEVTIEGAWRDKDSDDMRPLRKTLTVNVIDDVTLLVDELSGDTAELYTTARFDGKDYVNEMDFTPVVYVNGAIKADANVDVSISDTRVVFENNKLIGNESGISTVTVTYTDNGVSLSKTYEIEVFRPTAHYSGKVKYFSAHSGTLRDQADNFKEKTLVEYLFPGEGTAGFDAKQDGVALEVSAGKVLGVTPDPTGTIVKTLEIGSKKSIYTVDVEVYGQYVYEAKDLDVFTRTSKNVSFEGYVELAKDIDASSYTAGLHFNGETINTSNIPTTSNGSTFTGNAYYGGVFDGKGHSITGLTVSYNNSITTPSTNEKTAHGMFAALKGATIKNVEFKNVALGGRCLFSFYSKDTNFENISISVKSLVKQYNYQGNVMTYYGIVGGSLKNIYITIPSTYEIKTASGHTGYIYGSFATLTVTVSSTVTRPTFENIVVVSKLPIGYTARWGAESTICYAESDTATYRETIEKHYWARYSGGSVTTSMKNAWAKQDNYDPSITDYRIISLTGRAQVVPGVYRFDTVADLKADANIGTVLANFPSDYWTVSNGELVWG